MQKFFFLVVPFFLPVGNLVAQAANTDELKDTVLASIEEQYEPLVQASDAIWSFAETALNESQSAELLANYAEEQGFRVERGVAGMPTAFIASYGEGRPIIGIMGEYDALPRLSQAAEPHRNALLPDAPGQ